MQHFKNGKLTITCNQCNKEENNPTIFLKWLSLSGLTKITFNMNELNLSLYPDGSIPNIDFCSKKCVSEFFKKYFDLMKIKEK